MLLEKVSSQKVSYKWKQKAITQTKVTNFAEISHSLCDFWFQSLGQHVQYHAQNTSTQKHHQQPINTKIMYEDL